MTETATQDATETDPWEVKPEAFALTALRIPPGSETGIYYTATTFPKNPWAGCEHMIRTCRKVGFLKPSGTDTSEIYAVLDVVDEEGDIIQDFTIPHARAFRFLYRKLGWRIDKEMTSNGRAEYVGQVLDSLESETATE